MHMYRVVPITKTGIARIDYSVREVVSSLFMTG